ncbi:MAG: ABC transporter permease, partial [Pseudomonadota bacterium]
MNPFPIAWAFARANGGTSVLFLLLIAIATALGIAITSQERALREGSARAADPFDIVIAAPGSQTDLLMNVVYLRPSAVPLVPPEISLRILGEPRARLVAPLAFGDNYQGLPIVGTIAPLLEHMADGIPLEGRMFESDVEAVLGSAVPHPIGHQIAVAHGLGAINEGSHGSITAVGRMPPTGTAWDRAILVPIEFSWLAHNLTTGHPPGSDQIGPPWDPASLPGVPAFVVVADSLIAAYGLRQQYRTAETTAFFPAEVLVELYALLGDVRSLMGLLSLATQALVVAAILTGVMALMQLYRTRLAV